MPKSAKIARLPAELRNELDRRLQACGFGDLVQISEWLASVGHDISKSALSVYSIRNRQRIESARSSPPATADQFAAQDFRMRALEVASSVATTEQELLGVAGRCLQWTKTDHDPDPGQS